MNVTPLMSKTTLRPRRTTAGGSFCKSGTQVRSRSPVTTTVVGLPKSTFTHGSTPAPNGSPATLRRDLDAPTRCERSAHAGAGARFWRFSMSLHADGSRSVTCCDQSNSGALNECEQTLRVGAPERRDPPPRRAMLPRPASPVEARVTGRAKAVTSSGRLQPALRTQRAEQLHGVAGRILDNDLSGADAFD